MSDISKIALVEQLQSVEADYQKALQGNKSAKTRVKRVLLDTRKQCKEMASLLESTVKLINNER